MISVTRRELTRTNKQHVVCTLQTCAPVPFALFLWTAALFLQQHLTVAQVLESCTRGWTVFTFDLSRVNLTLASEIWQSTEVLNNGESFSSAESNGPQKSPCPARGHEDYDTPEQQSAYALRLRDMHKVRAPVSMPGLAL